MAQLLLFTDRPELEASVREASVKAGLAVSVHALDEVADAPPQPSTKTSCWPAWAWRAPSACRPA
jgi:hypothetical protein